MYKPHCLFILFYLNNLHSFPFISVSSDFHHYRTLMLFTNRLRELQTIGISLQQTLVSLLMSKLRVSLSANAHGWVPNAEIIYQSLSNIFYALFLFFLVFISFSFGFSFIFPFEACSRYLLNLRVWHRTLSHQSHGLMCTQNCAAYCTRPINFKDFFKRYRLLRRKTFLRCVFGTLPTNKKKYIGISLWGKKVANNYSDKKIVKNEDTTTR